jgi:acetylornithine/succinyldiaminopimelate/putrescine aminotransferase
MPLMHEHRILAQVAGYHTELIKFLPPVNIGEEALDYFLVAMGKVLAGLQRVPGSAWETVRTLAKGAAQQIAR